MKNKKAFQILLIGASALCLTLAFAFPNSSKRQLEVEPNGQEIGTHPALKQDLVTESGEKILEVVQASYQTTVNGLDSSSVMVRNLSGKNITALGIIWTITFTDENRDEIEQLVDYRLHQDIVNAKAIRPFTPYEEKFIPRLTKESFEEGQAIKSVKVEISFAEFEDSSGVRLEKSGMYKEILSQRHGAEIYKRWIEDGYGDDSRKITRVIGKLSGVELPNNQELNADKIKQGALIYRQWMRDILKDKGENALREQLHRQLLRQR